MKLSEIQQLFARDVVKLLEFIETKQYTFSFGETFRTAEQAELYFKEGKGIRDSLHCQKLAIDINLFDPSGLYIEGVEPHEQFGIYWESLSPMNRWGGKFKNKDANHYERNEKQS